MSIQAMVWVISQSKAKLGARLVLLAIANHADSSGRNAFPSIETIAGEAGLSGRQVQRALQTLRRIGEVRISRCPGRGQTNGFTLIGMGDNMSPLKGDNTSPIEPARVTFRALKGDNTSPIEPARVTFRALKGVRNVTRTLREPLSKKVRKKDPPYSPPKRGDGALEGFEDWWKGYPQKVGKGAAERAWPKARALVGVGELGDGVRRYISAKSPDREWCHPATWLNQKRWLDEPAQTQETGHGQGHGSNSPVDTLRIGAARAVQAIIERERLGVDRGAGGAVARPLLDGGRQ